MKRTPRFYNGTAKTGKNLSDLLPLALNKIQSKRGETDEAIFSFWFVLIGDKMGPFTKPDSFVDGVLTVKVKSATLYSLLCQHERPRLLKQLQEKFPVRGLFFKIG